MDSLSTFVKFGPKPFTPLAEFNQICSGQTLVFEFRGFCQNSDYVELTALIGPIQTKGLQLWTQSTTLTIGIREFSPKSENYQNAPYFQQLGFLP
jgi:hypothetical protein